MREKERWDERLAASADDRISRVSPRPTMTDELTIARLFRVPPERFTAERNRLVAHLRQAGEARSASEVAKLPRPTPSVWAINQAAHQDRPAVERLLTAADELKRAQLGRGSAEVAPLAKAYQAAVAALAERSLSSLETAGRPATGALRHRLTGTLMAASVDPALRKLLRAGQLRGEATTVGFDVFGGARPALRVVRRSASARATSAGAGSPPPEAPPPPEERPPPEARDEVRKRAELRVRVETARADVAGAESRVKEREGAEAELRRKAIEARERAQAARRAAVSARTEVARARARLRAAERAARPR